MDEAKALRQSKMAATGLLGVMGGLLALSYALPSGWPSALLQASSKAGLVGGVADWFAVTALFRHPLGLPIPHTAIVPRQKDRLAAAVGDFVAKDVLTDEAVKSFLVRVDVASTIAAALRAGPLRERAVEACASGVPHLMAALEHGAIVESIGRAMPSVADGSGPSIMAADMLEGVVGAGHHLPMVRVVLARVRDVLRENAPALKERLEQSVRQRGGAVVGWFAGDKVAASVLAALDAELDEGGPASGALVASLDAWLQEEVYRLRTDPMRAFQIGEACRKALASPEASEFVGNAWKRFRVAAEADALLPEGRTVRGVSSLMDMTADRLEASSTVRGAVTAGLERAVLETLPMARLHAADFITRAISSWDAKTVTAILEAKVGTDLQFVRMSGTLVGFIVGGALYAFLNLVAGGVHF